MMNNFGILSGTGLFTQMFTSGQHPYYRQKLIEIQTITEKREPSFTLYPFQSAILVDNVMGSNTY